MIILQFVCISKSISHKFFLYFKITFVNFKTHTLEFKRLFCSQEPGLNASLKITDIQKNQDSDLERRIITHLRLDPPPPQFFQP